MAFLRGVSQLNGALVNRSGSIIRFTTSQLPHLPPSDIECEVTLLDGKTVGGRFHRNPANPYIAGRDLVRWIKTWVQENQSVPVIVEQNGQRNRLRLRPDTGQRHPTKEAIRTRRRVIALGRMASRERRHAYEVWARDPNLRRVLLDIWPHKCQVQGCTSHLGLPATLLKTIIDVHHITAISGGGPDSPTNLCLLCANHHMLIHRAPVSTVESCDDRSATVRVNGITLEIKRNAADLWDLINV